MTVTPPGTLSTPSKVSGCPLLDTSLSSGLISTGWPRKASAKSGVPIGASDPGGTTLTSSVPVEVSRPSDTVNDTTLVPGCPEVFENVMRPSGVKRTESALVADAALR